MDNLLACVEYKEYILDGYAGHTSTSFCQKYRLFTENWESEVNGDASDGETKNIGPTLSKNSISANLNDRVDLSIRAQEPDEGVDYEKKAWLYEKEHANVEEDKVWDHGDRGACNVVTNKDNAVEDDSEVDDSPTARNSLVEGDDHIGSDS